MELLSKLYSIDTDKIVTKMCVCVCVCNFIQGRLHITITVFDPLIGLCETTIISHLPLKYFQVELKSLSLNPS